MRGLILFALVSACTPDSIKDERSNADGKPNSILSDTPNSADATGPNTALTQNLPVTYSNDLEPSLQKLCTASCHRGAPTPGPPLNSSAALKGALPAALATIDSGKMPKNLASLNASDKQLLAQLRIFLQGWGKNEVYALSLSDLKITYAADVSILTKALCTNCHQGAQPAGGLSLQNLDQLKLAMPRVLRAIESGRMPPKIDEIQKPRLIRFFTEWQNQGFP